MIRINGGQATLGANTFTGAQVAPSLALGGATIGTNALAVTGTVNTSDNLTIGGNFQLQTAGVITFGARSRVVDSADGVLALYNNAATGFSRLQFGGTTSSFPSIKRSGSALQARLADDSGNAYFQAASYYMNYNSFITDSSDGVIKLSNNAGTDFSLLQFGGTTTSFPAWQRVGSGFFAKLADNSANTFVAMNQLLINDGITAPVATVGYAKLYVDTADGDLKVIFGDGIIKTLATDT